ncbi:MAG: Fur family transcriptional regulator [Candidatus Thermoplasmatota archaeon]|nr:Fur family transcriptional regulator [Candidatus Thermoplasmatota archaeon]
METFVELLKTHNLKVTQQRLEILRYVESHLTHPTADEIFQSLTKKYPSLSKTTIYNTLETLTNAGIIQRLTICPTEHRYDFNHDMHHHFICKQCGKIFDIHFTCPNVETIEKDILKDGHRIEEVHGYFRGKCKDCLNKEGVKNG